MEEKVTCRTPTEGRDGVTNLPKWKFDAIQSAILTVLKWHVTSVKLEMEVRGEIERIPGRVPQRLKLPLT